MVVLGSKNSRMRDFFDVYMLARLQLLDGDLLAKAVRSTFDRRRTPIPKELPLALSSDFAAMQDKQTQWRAFLKKSRLGSAPEDLGDIIEHLRGFLEPVINAARLGRSLPKTRGCGGPGRRIASGTEGRADV